MALASTLEIIDDACSRIWWLLDERVCYTLSTSRVGFLEAEKNKKTGSPLSRG